MVNRNFVLVTVLTGALAWPGSVHAQNVTTVVEPPAGWFGVTISDQAVMDGRGNAFFDSYPVVTSVVRGSTRSLLGCRSVR